MKIDIIEKVKSPIESEKIEEIVVNSVSKLDLTGKEEIEILFIDKAEIAELNAKYREKNAVTDVLSFPQQQIPGEMNILGSIVICPEVVIEKNEDMIDVLKHGLLHLAGYNHEEDEDEWNKMAEKINCSL